MNVRRSILTTLLLSVLLLPLGAQSGLAQTDGPEAEVGAQAILGTAFTYQGELRLEDTLVDDSCDLQFGLWDVPSIGVQTGVTQTMTGVAMSGGRFAVQLDFGVSAFQGSVRWLGIAVRCPSETGTYQPLSPRQALTATPYALYALSAAPHNHLGQTWTGSNNPLVITGTFGAPNYAPLVLSNTASSGDGLRVSSAGDPSARLSSDDSNGIEVAGAEGHGMFVGRADVYGVHVSSGGRGGVYVGSAGNPSTLVSSSAGNGFTVSGAQGNGVYVGRADGAGVDIWSAGGDGVRVYSAGSPAAKYSSGAVNGFEVAGAQGYGLYVGRADAGGVAVASTGGDGVAVGSAGSPTTANWSTAQNGFEVAGAQGNGLFIGQADEDGVYVNSVGHPSAVVTNSLHNGVEVAGAEGHGLTVGHADLDGVHVAFSGYDGVHVYSAGNPTTVSVSAAHNGFEVSGTEGNGLYVGRADADGVHVASAGGDGVHVDRATNYAGYFGGDVIVTGTLTAGGNGLRVGTDGTTFKGVQAGTATLGPGGTGVRRFTITFPTPFSGTPAVIATPRGQGTYADTFVVTTVEITSTEFKVNVFRVDLAGQGWTQSLQLDWLAWEALP